MLDRDMFRWLQLNSAPTKTVIEPTTEEGGGYYRHMRMMQRVKRDKR